MPLYEYECKACHRRTEKIQKFSDPELTVCPFCGGTLERTLTAPAVHFAGGGWYKDLYSSAKPPAAGGSAEGGSAAPAGEGAPAAAPAASGGESAPTSATPSSGASASPAPAATPAPSSSSTSSSKSGS